MTTEAETIQSLTAEIVQPGSAATNLDALNLRISLQVAPRRWLRSLQHLIDATEQGQSLDVAVGRFSASMPAEFRSLVQASLRLPEPSRFVLDAIVSHRDSQDVRWQLILLFLYPLVMLVFTAGICALVCSMLYAMMAEGFADFGLIGMDQALAYVQDQQMALTAMFGILAWCLAAALTLRLVGPKWAGVAVVGGLPLYGKPLRWINLHELMNRLAQACRQTSDPNVATETMAASFHGSSNEVVADLAVRRVKAGVPTGVALTQSMLSDGLCAPVLLSIDHSSDMAIACENAAKTLRKNAETRCKYLATLLPIFVIITMATMVWGTLSGYFEIMKILLKMMSPWVGTSPLS